MESRFPAADGSDHVIKQGVLIKRTDRFRAWAPRFFVLKPYVLQYYISKDDEDGKKSIRKASESVQYLYKDGRLKEDVKKRWYSLKQCVVRCGMQARTGYPFSFYIEHTQTQQRMFLAAKDEESRIVWIQALLTAIGDFAITPLPCSNFKRSEESSPDLLFTLQCLASDNNAKSTGKNSDKSKKPTVNPHLAALWKILSKYGGKGNAGVGLRGSLVTLLRPYPSGPTAGQNGAGGSSSSSTGASSSGGTAAALLQLQARHSAIAEALITLLHCGADVNEVFTDDINRPWEAKRPPIFYALMKRMSSEESVAAMAKKGNLNLTADGQFSSLRIDDDASQHGKQKPKDVMADRSAKDPLWYCVFYLLLHGATPTYFNQTSGAQVVPAGNVLHDIARIKYRSFQPLPLILTEAARLAVRVGADANLQNTRGLTPLHMTLRKGNEACAFFLIEQCRADVTEIVEVTTASPDLELIKLERKSRHRRHKKGGHAKHTEKGKGKEKAKDKPTKHKMGSSKGKERDDRSRRRHHQSDDESSTSDDDDDETLSSSGNSMERISEQAPPMPIPPSIVKTTNESKSFGNGWLTENALDAHDESSRDGEAIDKSFVGAVWDVDDLWDTGIEEDLIDSPSFRISNSDTPEGSESSGSGTVQVAVRETSPSMSSHRGGTSEKPGASDNALRIKLGNRVGRGTILEGGSLLHSATVGVCMEFMQKLMAGEYGGRLGWRREINGSDSKGCTPIAYAVMQQQKEVFGFLFSQKADLMTLNFRGQNLLQQFILGARMPTKEFAEWMLQIIAPASEAIDWYVNGQDENGNTSLHLLLIVDMGSGITKLNIARKVKVEIMSYLLDIGADIEIKNYSFHTAYDFAKRSGESEILQVLEKHIRDKAILPQLDHRIR